jgi:hypothetical protein
LDQGGGGEERRGEKRREQEGGKSGRQREGRARVSEQIRI